MHDGKKCYALPYLISMRQIIMVLSFGFVTFTHGNEFTVLTYNIRHGAGNDGRADLRRIADVIKKSKADVVLLQEVDMKCERSGKVDQAAELGTLTKMHHAFGKAFDFQGGAYGQAILSRFPIEKNQVIKLPRADEERIAFRAEIRAPSVIFTAATLHLTYHSAEARTKQAYFANKELIGDANPIVLAGDFNDTPGSTTLEAFVGWAAVLKKEPRATSPAENPKHEIDHIFLRGMEQEGEAIVMDEPAASDHRPVMVKVTITNQN